MKILTEEQYQEVLNAKHPKRVLKSFFEVKKLPYNNWYKWDNRITFFVSENQGYGVGNYHEWYGLSLWGWLNFYLSKWKKATDKEVEEMLIKEAIKRGYEKGVKFIPLYSDGSNYNYNVTKLKENEFSFDPNQNSLLVNGNSFRIFANGIWAEKL